MLNLITGATGLIGSHLVEALVVRGEDVRALVRPTSRAWRLRELEVEIRVGNLLDNATLMSAAKGVDRIFHCAALVNDWGVLEDFEQANVQGVRRILAAATRANVSKFLFLSTSDIYGFPGRLVRETERPSPRGFPYSDTKIQGERLVWNHHERIGLPVSVLRPSTVYGPGAQLLVLRMVYALKRRKMIMVDHGRCTAGLTYVGNLVDALLLAADSERSVGRAYNISDGSKVTWKEYIDALASLAEVPPATRSYSHRAAFALASLWEGYYRLLGRTQRPPLTRMMVELMGTSQEFAMERATEELGYRPRVSFEEGIRYTGAWLRQSGQLSDPAGARDRAV